MPVGLSQYLSRASIVLASSAAVLVSSVAFGAPKDPSAEAARTRAAMAAIFAELQTLLPAAVGDSLGDPRRADEFRAAFRRMADQAEGLASHGSPLPPGSRLFAGALSRDVDRAGDFFAREKFDRASFIVTSIVDRCTACHTRQKSADAAISRAFVSAESLARLDPLERAAIAVATRQFSDGLRLYEGVFSEPGISPEALLGPLSNYLTVAVRVTREPARAARTLAGLAARPGVSEGVRDDLAYWAAVLRGTTEEDLVGTTLEDARASLRRATASQRYPADWRALIEFLIASSKLHDISRLPQTSPEKVAEVFELLGQAELGVAQNMWLSRADLYWESAVRAAPGTAPARRAFASLEREVRAGFTGSSGLHLPLDEAARIEELRLLAGSDPPTARDGEILFAQHCALCHGADADGHGPFAKDLMWIPADLTRIATRRGGEFPEDEVFALIARRDPLGSHRSPEMPRWGEFWSDDSKIDSLVAYLRTIQKP